ncbi:MAG: DUF5660 family protein [Candidatus Shapirobacteria bacterium]|jgi:hypothetical protein
MAGGFAVKLDPNKVKNLRNGLSGEFDSKTYSSQNSPDTPKFSLRGILGLGQSVEISHSPKTNWGEKLYFGGNHLDVEIQRLRDNQKEDLEKVIKQLQEEIKLMKTALGTMEKVGDEIVLQPISEISEYQLNFISRIRNFLSSLRQNINQATIWMETFNRKKKKKNYFWSTAKDKKKGGQQYMFSNEHSAARSGT